MISKSGRVELALTRAKAFHRAQQVIRNIGATVTASDLQRGVIEARFPISPRSWGEKLRVELSGADGAVTLNVSSRTRIGTTLFDFGKNADNVRRFVTAVAWDRYVVGSRY
jgi:hypothetical protein